MADEETTPAPAPAEEPTTQPQEAPAPEVVPTEPVTETPQAEPQTAQITVSEPLPVEPDPIAAATDPTPAGPAESKPEPPPMAASTQVTNAPITTGNARDMFVKARAVIQVRKHERLEKIMEVLNIKEKITNDEVEKLLHVSDATATRYLSALEKDGKIKQVGKTGVAVVYTKV